MNAGWLRSKPQWRRWLGAAGLATLVTAFAHAHPAAVPPVRTGGGPIAVAYRGAPSHARAAQPAPVRWKRGALAGAAFGGSRQGPRSFGGAITTVAAEARAPVPRASSESALRAGSIREDVARYNEERAMRAYSRVGDAARSAYPTGLGSPYRN